MNILIVTGLFNLLVSASLWLIMNSTHSYTGLGFFIFFSSIIAPILSIIAIILSIKKKKDSSFYIGLCLNIPPFIAFILSFNSMFY